MVSSSISFLSNQFCSILLKYCVSVCVPVCFIHPSVDDHLGQFYIYQSTWCAKYLCGVLA